MSEDRERQPRTEIARLTHDEASEILSSLLVGMAERGDTSPGVQRVAERAYAEIHRVEQSLYRQEIAPPTRTQEAPERSWLSRTVDTVNGWLSRGEAQQQKAFEAFEIEARDRARGIARAPGANAIAAIERRAELRDSGMEPQQIDAAIRREMPAPPKHDAPKIDPPKLGGITR